MRSYWENLVDTYTRPTFGKIATAPYRLGANWLSDTLGYTQYKNTKDSTSAQIDYNEYIKAGNQRAFADWYKNVGSQGQGRTIRYPELSYPGAVYRADTGTTRALFDASTSGANFIGNAPYRTAGLYGIGSRVARWI